MHPLPEDQLNNDFTQATIKTANDLRTIAHSLAVPLSELTLPEIEEAVEIISKMMPAGNVPGVILNGLARLSERRPPLPKVHRDIHLLFRSVEQVLDKAVYSAFFAGPAAVIWGYQHLLKLAGKSPDDAFPEGTWQFYVDYALREDTARHTNETNGFDTLLRQHRVALSDIDRLSAWVMTAIQTLHQYESLLENEWRERMYTRLLVTQTGTPFSKKLRELYHQWEQVRPYTRHTNASSESYPVYRRRKFDEFLAHATSDIPEHVLDRWRQAIQAAERDQLPSYLRQMSILSYLEPGEYGETRTPIRLQDALIGIIHNGAYFFVPVCKTGTNQPSDKDFVRSQIAAILDGRIIYGAVAKLTELVQVKRAELSRLLKTFPAETVSSLEVFRYAPILINADRRDRKLPLAELRQTERGIGSHALTIFDAGETFAFDQSHIYFDGAWGSAFAEIMTNEALSWARYFASLPPATPNVSGIRIPRIIWRNDDLQHLAQAAHIVPEMQALLRTIG
jgi:hypothetical protein